MGADRGAAQPRRLRPGGRTGGAARLRPRADPGGRCGARPLEDRVLLAGDGLLPAGVHRRRAAPRV
ncbi:LEPR-XLL domain-containing protein [Streptomyces sp. Je 1-332]|uniref:LEPR-XLL domain-containing protein n=1 Tax=Streptomyces sp. Je 1-332 TaxID=3231270 RepID=UPI003459232F